MSLPPCPPLIEATCVCVYVCVFRIFIRHVLVNKIATMKFISWHLEGKWRGTQSKFPSSLDFVNKIVVIIYFVIVVVHIYKKINNM